MYHEPMMPQRPSGMDRGMMPPSMMAPEMVRPKAPIETGASRAEVEEARAAREQFRSAPLANIGLAVRDRSAMMEEPPVADMPGGMSQAEGTPEEMDTFRRWYMQAKGGMTR